MKQARFGALPQTPPGAEPTYARTYGGLSWQACRQRRLGGSARRLRNRISAARVFSLGLGRMAWSRISLALAQPRHSDCGAAGGSPCRGGKTDDLVGEIVGQHGGNQMRQQPGSRQNRIGRAQFVQPAQGLQPFDADLDLSAVAIEFGDAFGGLRRRRERGEQHQKAGRLDRARIDLMAVLVGLA